jgi:WhiB family transcriptional regulator, redox-sensing transcriptional regulator
MTTPLAEALQRAGMTVPELARAVGASLSVTYDWTNGHRKPRPERAAMIADIVGVPVEQLFPGENRTRNHGRLIPEDARFLTIHEVMDAPATGRAGWEHKAACRTSGADPELWWATGTTAAAEAARDQARAICRDCPVVGDCREAFLGLPPVLRSQAQAAIWAGVSGDELVAAARQTEIRRARAQGRPIAETAHEPPPRTRFEQVLRERGLNASQVAALAGQNTSKVRSWARGRYAPTVEGAQAIADAVGVPVHELFDRVSTNNAPAPIEQPPRTRFEQVLRERGLTQAEAARQLHVHPGVVARWVTGSRAPSPEVANNAARNFGMPVEELFDRIGRETPTQAARTLDRQRTHGRAISQ